MIATHGAPPSSEAIAQIPQTSTTARRVRESRRAAWLGTLMVVLVLLSGGMKSARAGSIVINEIHCNPDEDAERVEFIEAVQCR